MTAQPAGDTSPRDTCQTPGAVYRTAIQDRHVSVSVDLPHALGLSEAQARLLEASLHDAVELALAEAGRDADGGDT